MGKPWHDDPYHEYFVLGGVDPYAILGQVALGSVMEDKKTLLPGFDHVDRHEGLHASLGRFRSTWPSPSAFIPGSKPKGVGVSYDDMWCGQRLQPP